MSKINRITQLEALKIQHSLFVPCKLWIYSCGQKFTYTCKEHVYHGSLEFPMLSTTLIFLWWNDGNTYYFVRKNIHAFRFFYKFIIRFLEIWQNLLGQKYTYSNLNYEFWWCRKLSIKLTLWSGQFDTCVMEPGF